MGNVSGTDSGLAVDTFIACTIVHPLFFSWGHDLFAQRIAAAMVVESYVHCFFHAAVWRHQKVLTFGAREVGSVGQIPPLPFTPVGTQPGGVSCQLNFATPAKTFSAVLPAWDLTTIIWSVWPTSQLKRKPLYTPFFIGPPSG